MNNGKLSSPLNEQSGKIHQESVCHISYVSYSYGISSRITGGRKDFILFRSSRAESKMWWSHSSRSLRQLVISHPIIHSQKAEGEDSSVSPFHAVWDHRLYSGAAYVLGKPCHLSDGAQP